MNKRNNDLKYTENKIQIIEVQESERKRIARDLHDAVLQNLTHISHQLELSQLYMDKDILQAKLELLSAQKNMKTTIEEIRNIVFDLRPMSFDDLGFKEAFDNFYELITRYSDFKVEFDVDDIRDKSDYFMLTLYRIAREAIMNAIRHSGGDSIIFKCKKYEDKIFLEIIDNGKGFNEENLKEKNHYGLNVIRERVELLGGTIDIISNKGTKIVVEIPL